MDVKRLCEIFRNKDVVQLEINHWAIMSNRVYCVDAKVSIDDNAIFKHPDIMKFKAGSEKWNLSSKVEDEKNGLSGNIEYIVNGDELAMAHWPTP